MSNRTKKQTEQKQGFAGWFVGAFFLACACSGAPVQTEQKPNSHTVPQPDTEKIDADTVDPAVDNSDHPSADAASTDSDSRDNIPDGFEQCPIQDGAAEYISIRERENNLWEITFHQPDGMQTAIGIRTRNVYQLNGDAHSDLYMAFGTLQNNRFIQSCHGTNRCEQGIYAGCGDNKYVAALPRGDYGWLRVGGYPDWRTGGWRQIVEEQWRLEDQTYRMTQVTWQMTQSKFTALSDATYPLTDPPVEAPHVDWNQEYDEVNVVGIPAISSDGKLVVVLNRFDDLAGGTRMALDVYRTRDGSLQQQIELQNRPGDEFEPRLMSPARQAKAVSYANVLFAKKSFIPMLSAGGQYGGDVILHEYAGGIHFQQDMNGGPIAIVGKQIVEIDAPSMPSSPFCCGYLPEDGEPTECALPLFLTGAWVHEGFGVAVMRFDNHLGPDGCETESEFRLWSADKKNRSTFLF
ncbi:MAG: hypothetical protein JXX29_09425 [Deltaproteobacteria bacterium]|nr:hypothetical protein [Deltaproteobacteria bacterium]MBN2671884.1 hypothetical protein [Deltaproteobacteria bacterium]